MATQAAQAVEAQDDTDTDGGSPEQWYDRWTKEFGAANSELSKWRKSGEEIINWFLDKRNGDDANRESRRPYFTANVQTLRAILFGKTPKVSVARKFGDAKDNVARVASEMWERILNEDIEHASNNHDKALEHALDDFLLPGLGNIRNLYVMEEEQDEGKEAITETGPDGQLRELAPAVPPSMKKVKEDVETVYEHWQDQVWSPSRTHEELRWWAFKAQMSRKQLIKRFGKEKGQKVPLNSKKDKGGNATDAQQVDPWGRADVWEIWDKEHRKKFWLVEGHGILDMQDDELGLKGFWPFPRPMMANLTTSALVPRPDFTIAEDIYKDINEISTRIALLVKAIRAVGLYDRNAPELARLLSEARLNELIPTESWNKFQEKGGIKGAVDWLPIDMIVQALEKLREMRQEAKQELFEVTGMSDIVRGQAETAATATEQSIKAKFASVRLEALQVEFARFASDVQRIRAEIMSKHFDVETLIERSNIMRTADGEDPQLIQQAAELMKSDFYTFRIEIKPEAVSLTDYAAMRSERSEVIQTIAGFVQVAGPLAQQMPGAGTFVLELLSWLVASVKGSSEIQGVMDRAIASIEQAQKQAAMQPPAPPPPDPKLQTEMVKGQLAQAHTKLELQADLARTDAESKAVAQQEMTKAQIGLQVEGAKQRMRAVNEITTAIHPAGTEGA